MKYSIFVIIFSIAVIHYETVNCGLVKDFFKDVHETAHKVREDIKDVLHPNKGNDENKKSEETTTKGKEEVSVKEPNVKPVKSDEKPVEGQQQTTVVAAPSTPAVPTDTAHVTTPAGPATNGTNDGKDKDGRENFKGNCATGFERTSDGRCKPTF